MRRHLVSPVGVTAALIVTALAGCGSNGHEAADPQERVGLVEVGDHTLLVQLIDEGGADAAFAGPVGVSGQGCYGISNEDGSVTPVIWPLGFGLTEDGRLRGDDGTVYAAGDALDAGGGFVDDLRSSYGPIVDECLGGGVDGIVLGSVRPVPSG